MPHLIARAGHIVRRHQQHRHVTCAAKHLQRHGCAVTVLEGRDRLGGRVVTDGDTFGVPVDLGASIITGTEVNVKKGLRGDLSATICGQVGLEITPLRPECPLFDLATRAKVSEAQDKRVEEYVITISLSSLSLSATIASLGNATS